VQTVSENPPPSILNDTIRNIIFLTQAKHLHYSMAWHEDTCRCVDNIFSSSFSSVNILEIKVLIIKQIGLLD
jgi:phosphodiesterase/alkaline phosphatase D-like protein